MTSSPADTTKPVHTLVLDTGAVIRNEPSVSTLLRQSEILVTIPAVISEIKDAVTRSRVETTLLPFLTLQTPSPASVKFVTDFARRTGDLAVLSKPDIQIVALTYEIECERNGGDWRLRKAPGQKGVNGAPPGRSQDPEATPLEQQVQDAAGGEAQSTEQQVQDATGCEAQSTEQQVQGAAGDETPSTEQQVQDAASGEAQSTNALDVSPSSHDEQAQQDGRVEPSSDEPPSIDAEKDNEMETITIAISQAVLDETPTDSLPENVDKVDSAQESSDVPSDDSDSDGGGWITPSNLKKKQNQDTGASSTTSAPEPKTMQVAVLTTDFAMQNVILQINLNLLSPSLTRVKHLKTFVQRCHGCFGVCKDLSKQFCPRCGQATLTRVSCSTSASGTFKLHLKKNMQWNTRGDRYSVPKPVHGSSNTRRNHGGGKGAWGTELILTEDQKEYQSAQTTEKRIKERSLMDEDYLPGILTGDRGRAGGRIKVGAGRNVNSKKR